MDVFTATLMSYVIPWSFAIFMVSGAWLYFKVRLVSSLFFSLGAALVMLNLVMQRFFPVWSATYDNAGNVITAQGPTIETYIFSLLSSFGLALCAVSFAVLSYRMSRGYNT
jgi:hypothetical protein